MPRKNVKGENEMPAGGTRIRKFAVYKLAPGIFTISNIESSIYKLATNKQLRGYYAKNRVAALNEAPGQNTDQVSKAMK